MKIFFSRFFIEKMEICQFFGKIHGKNKHFQGNFLQKKVENYSDIEKV